MSIPAFLSGIHELDNEVYITDQNNESRIPLEAVDTVQPDWDIDRSGSKSRLDITTYLRTLEDGMWIAPYQVIIPETGDIRRQQMGHFCISTPSASMDGSIGYDGRYKVVQQASGGDIVDLLAKARLSETFATPRTGVVMEDIRALIKLGTAGRIGPNAVQNGGFEQEGTGWTLTTGGGATGVTHTWQWVSANYPIPEGGKSWGPVFGASQPAGAFAAAYQDIPVPRGFSHLYISGLAQQAQSGQFYGYMAAAYLNVNGNTISGATLFTPRKLRTASAITRVFAFGAIPNGAVKIRLFVYAITDVGGNSGSVRQAWDDIQLRGCSRAPLPDGRINLPLSSVVATSRIQTVAGKSFAYDAINADRLAPIGNHALYTQQDGGLTTSPYRDLSTAVPKRQYSREDIRFVGDIQTERSATNRHNHFMAIKEDMQDATKTMLANAYNTDPNDPWSIHNMPLSSADPIMMPDAVDLAALQAAANVARDRSSEQEMIRLQVVPDPELLVHDVIEIVDSELPDAIGKWSIEYLRPGMRPGDPLTEIVARRNRSSKGVV